VDRKMKRIDEKLNDSVRFKTSDNENWLKNHTLSEDQVKHLMYNKYQRALKDQKNLEKIKYLDSFTD
jgi:hypothetical protein